MQCSFLKKNFQQNWKQTTHCHLKRTNTPMITSFLEWREDKCLYIVIYDCTFSTSETSSKSSTYLSIHQLFETRHFHSLISVQYKGNELFRYFSASGFSIIQKVMVFWNATTSCGYPLLSKIKKSKQSSWNSEGQHIISNNNEFGLSRLWTYYY